MRVRLTKKLADMVDGIDLSGCSVSDVLDLGAREARMLVAEGWAEPQRPTEDRRRHVSAASHLKNPAPALAADRPRRSKATRRTFRRSSRTPSK